MRKSRCGKADRVDLDTKREWRVSARSSLHENGMSAAMFYTWGAKFGGIDGRLMK